MATLNQDSAAPTINDLFFDSDWFVLSRADEDTLTLTPGSGVTITNGYTGATGSIVVTYPTTRNDELGTAHTLNFRYAMAVAASTSAAYHVQVVPTSANVLTVKLFDLAGGATGATGVNILVTAY